MKPQLFKSNTTFDLREFQTKLQIPNELLEDTIDNVEEMEHRIMEELLETSTRHLFESIKREYPDYPDEIITAFITQYFDFEISSENNFITLEQHVTVTPYWKEINQIDFNSKENKLLDDYFLKI